MVIEVGFTVAEVDKVATAGERHVAAKLIDNGGSNILTTRSSKARIVRPSDKEWRAREDSNP